MFFSRHNFVIVFPVAAVLSLAPRETSAQFIYSDFSSLSDLQLNGATTQSGNRLRLTSSGGLGGRAGSAYHTILQPVAAGFSTNFQFQITMPAGLQSADGFTFIIQNAPAGANALGTGGGFLGYSGIANSVVIEFDNFPNGLGQGDPNGFHVAVHSNDTGVNRASGTTLIGSAVSFPAIEDRQIHTARIDYAPGTLSLFIDGSSSPLLTVPFNLENQLNLDNGRAYVGFTSGVASGSANHDILNWAFTPSTAVIPEPSSIVICGLGMVAFAMYCRRRPVRKE